MRSVLVTYVSNLGNLPRTVGAMCPSMDVRAYVIRRVEGSLGCVTSGSRERFVGSLGDICETFGRRATLGGLSVLGRG